MQGQSLQLILLISIPLLAMYFMIILPQKRREKQMQQLLSSLNVGDDIVTIGGIIGKILNINDQEVALETSVEKSQIKIMKWAIKSVLPKEQM